MLKIAKMMIFIVVNDASIWESFGINIDACCPSVYDLHSWWIVPKTMNSWGRLDHYPYRILTVLV